MSALCYVCPLLCLPFVMSAVCYVRCLLCPPFVMSIVCYVHCLLCPPFVMSAVCYVRRLLCPLFVMSTVCYVRRLLCLPFVMSSVCYVHCLLCPPFVRLGFVVSSVCLSRAWRTTLNRYNIWNEISLRYEIHTDIVTYNTDRSNSREYPVLKSNSHYQSRPKLWPRRNGGTWNIPGPNPSR